MPLRQQNKGTRTVEQIRASLFGGAPVTPQAQAPVNLFGAGSNPEEAAARELARRAQQGLPTAPMQSVTGAQRQWVGVGSDAPGQEVVSLAGNPTIAAIRDKAFGAQEGPPQEIKIVRKETRYTTAELAELEG